VPKRLLIVEDNPTVRKAIRAFLAGRSDLEVCGEAVDGVDAIEKASELRPDLIVLDFSMPRMHGLEAGRRLRELMPAVPLVLFTMHSDAVSESDLARAGIKIAVSKTSGLDTLVKEVQRLLKG
jgi:DNA-binding NarL/FixJ family response regulator